MSHIGIAGGIEERIQIDRAECQIYIIRVSLNYRCPFLYMLFGAFNNFFINQMTEAMVRNIVSHLTSLDKAVLWAAVGLGILSNFKIFLVGVKEVWRVLSGAFQIGNSPCHDLLTKCLGRYSDSTSSAKPGVCSALSWARQANASRFSGTIPLAIFFSSHIRMWKCL